MEPAAARLISLSRPSQTIPSSARHAPYLTTHAELLSQKHKQMGVLGVWGILTRMWERFRTAMLRRWRTCKHYIHPAAP